PAMAPTTASRRLTPGTKPMTFASNPLHSSGRVMLSGKSWVSKSMNVSAISDQMSKQAAAAVGVTPKRRTAAMVSAPVRSSMKGYLAEIGAAQAEQRPRRNRKLKTGMFSNAAMRWPQAGHCERGVIRLYGGSSGGGSPDSSAHCACQPRSSIFGSRWTTTLRKLPTQRPTMPLTSHVASGSVNVAGMRGSARPSDDRSELEDRQVHRDHETPDHDSEEHDDDRLEEAR